jgi:hypothetical protein
MGERASREERAGCKAPAIVDGARNLPTYGEVKLPSLAGGAISRRACQGSCWLAGHQENWGIFKRHFWGELIRHRQHPSPQRGMHHPPGSILDENPGSVRSGNQQRVSSQERPPAGAKPIVEAMKPWMEAKLATISGKSTLAVAIRYSLSRWEGLVLFLDDSRIDIDSNAVERAMPPIGLGRKNHLFAGSDGGAEHWAVLASLVETCKRSEIDPQAYLADVLTKIVGRHPMSSIDELLPVAYIKEAPEAAVA